MAVAGLVVVLFHKLKQPPILGYLLAGLLIGPFTLPRLTLTLTNQENTRLLADLGLVLLLFALGLEFGWRRIRQVGFSVLVIGSGEILVMISLGYGVGRLLGWTALESIFLGAALSISSSAILVKVLRDSGRLSTQAGRIIVGVLVVEDFAAVLLLAVLSGLAPETKDTISLRDVGLLVIKLGIFGASSLVLGGIFVPRIIKFVSQFRSRETLLLSSLALCFTMALIGQTLGISAAAGAFLIGTVVGDTEESGHITEVIEPIRDMFGALFFVSIGMLIDFRVIAQYWWPTLVISLVFVLGKVLGNTAGAFVTGQPGRVPVQVGTGMPQIGEFSLAMMKVGVEQNAIGAFAYQVIAGVTAITSLVYPYIARSADRVADVCRRCSPGILQRSTAAASVALQHFSSGLSLDREATNALLGPSQRLQELGAGLGTGLSIDREFAVRIRRMTIPIVINLAIIVVLVATGAFAARFAQEIGAALGIAPVILGNIIGIATLLLCVPSVVAMWRGLRYLSDAATSYVLWRRGAPPAWGQERLRNVIRDAVSAALIIFIGVWSLPLILELLSLGDLAAPLPLVVLAVLVFVAIRTLTRMHGQLVTAVSRTFLGDGSDAGDPDGRAGRAVQDIHGDGMPPGQRAGGPGPAGGAAPQPLSPSGVGVATAALTSDDAGRIALAVASQDRSPYQRRLRGRELFWDIKEILEVQGCFRVTLAFRAVESAPEDAGEEELYLDPQGTVRVRQIIRWPAPSRR
jgi:CPA2 family monovalent cation:H+ antiporter-2